MRKIPTLFQRSEDRRSVIDEVSPGCEWVLAGEGTPTRKYDGTCVLIDKDGSVWCRREVKPGKEPPEDWREIDADPTTGKRVGWEPYYSSGFAKWVVEAVNEAGGWDPDDGTTPALRPGTYELCGPKINGNPEDFDLHELIPHGKAGVLIPDLSFDGLRGLLTDPGWKWEGIVWHHPDGRMAKIKRRDFPVVV